MSSPSIRAFHDVDSGSVCYLAWDPDTGDAAAVDPVLGWEICRGRIHTETADALLAALRREGLRLRLVLETRIHLDHLSAAAWLRERTGARVCAAAGARTVQAAAAETFGLRDLRPDGGDFDRLLEDGEEIPLGGLRIETLALPGMTPADAGYRIGDELFLGDLLPCPGAPDDALPGADGQARAASLRRLRGLPEDLRVWIGRARCAPGQDVPLWHVRLRERIATIDALLASPPPPDPDGLAPHAMPPLLPLALQINVRAGRFPPADPNGRRHLLLPVQGPVPGGRRPPRAAAALERPPARRAERPAPPRRRQDPIS